MQIRTFLASLALLLPLPSAAHAGDLRPAESRSPGEPQSCESKSVRESESPTLATNTKWYGLPAVLTDLSTVGLVTAGTLVGLSEMGPIHAFSEQQNTPRSHLGSNALLLTAGATYSLGAPINHAAHGHWDKAGISLGMRLLPIAIGAPLAAAKENDVNPVGVGIVFVGSLAAMVFDDLVLAREPVSRTPKVNLTPDVGVQNGSMRFGVSGTF